MVDELSVNEKMARWHDWHAEQFPAGHPYHTMHERTAAELRSRRTPIRALPRFCWSQQHAAVCDWADAVGLPNARAIQSVAWPDQLRGSEGLLLVMPEPRVPADLIERANRLGFRVVHIVN